MTYFLFFFFIFLDPGLPFIISKLFLEQFPNPNKLIARSRCLLAEKVKILNLIKSCKKVKNEKIKIRSEKMEKHEKIITQKLKKLKNEKMKIKSKKNGKT